MWCFFLTAARGGGGVRSGGAKKMELRGEDPRRRLKEHPRPRRAREQPPGHESDRRNARWRDVAREVGPVLLGNRQDAIGPLEKSL